ncbi:hypothetical protein G6F62_001741 [Rhizopus arrhizus]|nr:hypothetical protein G6F23_000178 [Rhizopus arrhizus]KAG0768937.1 hypothetical protein G6F24_001497 [Rhizopus arrhizus]KAG0794943.1 hypothetical protein G6F21_002484 [Rhizopus arrhizus]KAG0802411.1 hypothetical protein G6F22_000288 [Rhizopus arrhizus]KAG0818814.1 hypothetical protein G6F20_001261 [Rhizopus arrhizus]
MNQEDSNDARLERILRNAQRNKIELFDGKNSPQNISIYGFLLGIVCGGGFIFSFYGSIPQLGLFLSALTIFHFMEYLSTALFNPHTLTLDSYLINHGRQYHAAHTAAFIEFFIEYYFFPRWKTFNYISYLVDHKEKDHVLVTHGIYKIMRHPSYFGFFWWALGAQLLLLNPVCFVGFIFVLQKFFSDRITYEEHTLQRFFGQEWIEYKAKTPTWMPFI